MKKIEKTPEQWQSELSPEAFYVCRQKGTERAFSGQYAHHHEEGIYHCTCCKEPLFSSDTKFESGTGWPSFFQPVNVDIIERKEDRTFFMIRTEVLCASCGAHLGHVFPDGPPPTGLRYCINSVALEFRPAKP